MKANEIKWGPTRDEAVIFKTEYTAGRDSGSRGVSFHNCPHKPGTIAYDGWTRGWKSVNTQTTTDTALTEARAAGATHRDGRDPNTFYKQERHETLRAFWDGEDLTAWRWFSTYPPESAGVI